MTRFENAMNERLELNMKNRNKMAKHRKTMGLHEWLRSFCVVACNPGRAVGKTTWVLDNAGADDAILTVHPKEFQGKTAARVIGPRTYESAAQGQWYYNIFVDEPRLFFDLAHLDRGFEIARVIEKFGGTPDQTFIFLGE